MDRRLSGSLIAGWALILFSCAKGEPPAEVLGATGGRRADAGAPEGGANLAGAGPAETGGSPIGGGGSGTGGTAGLETGGTTGTGGVVVVTGGNGGTTTGVCTDPDAPPVAPQPGEISLMYKNGATAASVGTINATFNINKTTNGYVPLHLLKFRYWYTPDSVTNEVFECYYAAVGAENLTHEFGAGYIEIGFTAAAGDLDRGRPTGDIQMALHSADYQGSYDQTNDHSFDAAASDFVVNDRVTLYYCGQLLSGVEPE